MIGCRVGGNVSTMKRYTLAFVLLLAACSETARTTTEPVSSTAQSTASTTETTSAATTVSQSIDVTFPSEGFDLAGTLQLPAVSEPAPAVVLMHGSGPQSRETPLPGQLNMAFGFEIPVFAELATALQEDGWAVLTFDKRSCGPFNGCADNGYPLPGEDLTIEAFIDDARAAVDFLRDRAEVDPALISILGHSQGAQFVPVMLDEDPRLAKGIMVAGSYRPVDEITQAQLDSTIELLGELGIDREQALAMPAVTPLVDIVDGLADLRSGGREPVAGVSAEFWQSWFDLRERSLAAASRITQPLLVLNGEYDWNIPPSEAEAWGSFLSESGADYELVTLPCVTHALNCVSEPDPTAITPMDIGSSVAPEVIETILGFLAG